MKNEAQFKVAFRNSVRAQKGYTLSLAAPTLPGTPDLYCIMPNYMPVLLEAKWLGNIPNRKFKRKVQYSPMQLSYANKLNAVHPFAMMGLVGLTWNKITYCVLTPINPTKNEITSEFFADYNRVTRQLGAFDVRSLFAGSPIPLLDRVQETTGLSTHELIDRTVGITDAIRGTTITALTSAGIANCDQLTVPG